MIDKTEVRKLKELAEVITGVSVPSKVRKTKGKWMLLRSRDIFEDSVFPSEVFVPDKLAKKYANKAIVPGDILLSIVFEQYKVGVVPRSFGLALPDRGLVVIRPKKINKEYLHHFLTSKTGRSLFVGHLAKMVRGSVIKFVTKKDVAELNIPILPENLLEVAQETSNVASKINEMRKVFEIEIVKNVQQFLLDKGWKKEQISLEHPISGGLRADIVLIKKGKPKILIEIKKDMRNTKSVQNELSFMSKAAGIKESYLVTGEGIQKINEKGKVESVIDLPSPDEGKNE